MEGLDDYLTREPDNGYNDWVEAIWNLIPKETISNDEYEKHEDFFDVWHNYMAGSAEATRENPQGFWPPDQAARTIINRFYDMVGSYPLDHFKTT